MYYTHLTYHEYKRELIQNIMNYMLVKMKAILVEK